MSALPIVSGALSAAAGLFKLLDGPAAQRLEADLAATVETHRQMNGISPEALRKNAESIPDPVYRTDQPDNKKEK